ncbi:MAG: hypothetical protein Q8P18_00920 [Pseudomonadota bacterium]|nr:hypothetical protein [Pseudomonadota bacterium]
MIAALLALVACEAGPAIDPRPGLVARLAAAAVGPTPPSATIEEQVLLGHLAAACAGAKLRAAKIGEDEDWRSLLLVTARSHPMACATEDEADALAAWAAPNEAWRGVRAEWIGARGDQERALAALGPVGNDASRLRLALGRGDGDAARFAAEGALVDDPRDVLACRIVGLAALAEGDAAWTIETAACGGLGARAPELVRMRADALDLAGEHAAAEAAYASIGADVHRAALIYQEGPTPERLAEANRLLAVGAAGRPPPAALHAVWMALIHGGTPSLVGLDSSLPATLARAMVQGDDAALAALEDAPGAPAAVVRARLHAARGDRARTEAALLEALAAAPAEEPVHRARVGLLLRVKGDVASALADWAAQDPDHVAAVGRRGSRDVPWLALVPDTWADLAERHPDPRMRSDAPAGADSIGARIRAARALSASGSDPRGHTDALASLMSDVPGLDGLVRERYQSGPSPPNVPDRDP